MSHWWWQWAERIARMLAELWIRSQSEAGGAPGPESSPPSADVPSANATDELSASDAPRPQ